MDDRPAKTERANTTSARPASGLTAGTGPKLVTMSPRAAFERGLRFRSTLTAKSDASHALRVFSGAVDGMDGVYVDVYGPGAVMNVYEGRTPTGFDPATAAPDLLSVLGPIGVKAVYHKPFARDRSQLGGELPACVTEATPAAGAALPEAILIREERWNLEIRLYDGLSTGLFLDQRENRRFVCEWCARLVSQNKQPPAVLNTFAYTCAFSVAAAVGGALTTSVDVSGRYLEWGKRSFGHNAIDIAPHRFAKMDTFEFFNYARRKGLMYDLVILDPPSFASGSRKKGIRPWSAVTDYARLVWEAAGLLNTGGVILASTNTQELCVPGRLEREITRGLAGPRDGAGLTQADIARPRWIKLPAVSADFAREKGRFAALAFSV